MPSCSTCFYCLVVFESGSHVTQARLALFVAEDNVHGAPWPTAVVAHFQTYYSLEWETLHIMPRARTPHSASFYQGLFLVCVPKQLRIKQTKEQALPPLTLPRFDHGIETKLGREVI